MFGTLTFSVTWIILASVCRAQLLPPSNITSKWMDDLTVNVSWSWERPEDLPRDCSIQFEYKHSGAASQRTSETHFLESVLSNSAAQWVFSVQTVGASFSSCEDQRSSAEELLIKAPKPPADVKDFECYLSDSDMNCSWISDPLSPVSIFSRQCGETPDLLKQGFSKCDSTSTSGRSRVCQLKGSFLQKELCMVANTTSTSSTFKAPKKLALPNLNVTEEGTNLLLTFKPLKVKTSCSLYIICFRVCNTSAGCKDVPEKKGFLKIPYDKKCQYEFQYRVRTSDYCTGMYSGWSERITYGVTEDPDPTDWTLKVVAILIPVIVSAFVILSCVCFRRHKEIICPEVPYPSIIFKEMINGNRETKPSATMYAPVQEPIEPLVIVPHVPRGSDSSVSTGSSDRSGLVPT